METAAITVRWQIDNVVERIEKGERFESEPFDGGRWSISFQREKAKEGANAPDPYGVFVNSRAVGTKGDFPRSVEFCIEIETTKRFFLFAGETAYVFPTIRGLGWSSAVSQADLVKHCQGKVGLVVQVSVYQQKIQWQSSIVPQVTLCRRLATLFEDSTTDVVFRIRPDSQQSPERLLFAHRSILITFPYFKTLFGPGFAEESAVISLDDLVKETDRSTPQDALDDDDTTEWLPVDEDEEPPGEAPTFADLPEGEAGGINGGDGDAKSAASTENRTLRQVVVVDAGWTTYRALLYWMYTHKVSVTESAANYLVHLESHDPVPASGGTEVIDDQLTVDTPMCLESSESRRTWLLNRAAAAGRWNQAEDDIEPTSPHALYRLSDKLDIGGLKALTKSAIIDGFTVENVLYELFSSTSYHHTEIQDAARDFALSNWEQVKMTSAFQRVVSGSCLGRIEGASEIWMKLLTKFTTGGAVAPAAPVAAPTN